MIKINIDKAKEIHKNNIRSVRNPLLQKKDVEYIRALEAGDTEKIAEVVAEKDALRNVTAIVDTVEISSTSVNEIISEIKEIWDENLLGINPTEY
jgi:hypothetical protein